MLWGTWCASCAAEIKRVPALAGIARPLPFVTLAIDPAHKARTALVKSGSPIGDAYADDRPPAEVLADWGGKGAILPLAVAIDRQGRVCGRKRGLLGTDQVRQWARQCSR
ncbi:TlpA family protein disulfide reductase [uncultured Sphingomonas sp.]|uniref:TlpA family protein disulfide reductase n=1 Tax=uncultured Sphingomonas sp. TaxID=158754 RepID=UPI0035CC828B